VKGTVVHAYIPEKHKNKILIVLQCCGSGYRSDPELCIPTFFLKKICITVAHLYSDTFIEKSFTNYLIFSRIYSAYPSLKGRDPQLPGISAGRRKIRLIEGNAKCRHLNKLTCKRTLRQVFIFQMPRTPYSPPYTLYTCTQVYLFTRRRGEVGRVEPERRG
jgi:hypothetical protein